MPRVSHIGAVIMVGLLASCSLNNDESIRDQETRPAQTTPPPVTATPVPPSPDPTMAPSATPVSSPTPAPIILEAPAGLAMIPGSAQITLEWQPVSEAQNYQVYLSTSHLVGPSAYQLSSGPVAATSYTFSGLTSGQLYFAVVVAQSNSGRSPASAVALGQPTATDSSGQVTVSLKPKTLVYGLSELDQLWSEIREHSSESARIAGSGLLASRIQTGSVIVLAPKDEESQGIFATVTAITSSGEDLVLTLADASIADAFEELDFRFNGDLVVDTGGKAAFVEAATIAKAESCPLQPLANLVSDLSFSRNLGLAMISGSACFESRVDYGGSLKQGTYYADVNAINQINLSASIFASAELNPVEVTVLERTVKLPSGNPMFWGNIVLIAKLGAQGKADAELEVNAIRTDRLYGEVVLDRRLGVVASGGHVRESNIVSSSLCVNLNVENQVLVELRFNAYGVAGPRITGIAGLGVELEQGDESIGPALLPFGFIEGFGSFGTTIDVKKLAQRFDIPEELIPPLPAKVFEAPRVRRNFDRVQFGPELSPACSPSPTPSPFPTPTSIPPQTTPTSAATPTPQVTPTVPGGGF